MSGTRSQTTPTSEGIPFRTTLVPAFAATHKALHPRKHAMREATFLKKDEQGRERRYVVGVSSGPVYDAHGERMMEECIKGFNEQVQENTILFVHPHTDDLISNSIGKIFECSINDKGEWVTVMRCWDQYDADVDPRNVARADTFWLMTRGEGPYNKPTRISEFSVQGIVYPEDIIQEDQEHRAIKWLELDAVAAVTKGAYPQEPFKTVEKIFKQYDVARNAMRKTAPKTVKKGELRDEMAINNFERQHSDLHYNMNCKIRDIMVSGDFTPDQKREKIAEIHNEFMELSNELFEKMNYNMPEEAEMRLDDQTTPGEGVMPPSAEHKPEVEHKDDKAAIAEMLTNAAHLLTEAAEKLGGQEEMMDEEELEDARRALDENYTKGEMDDDEYAKQKKALDEHEKAISKRKEEEEEKARKAAAGEDDEPKPENKRKFGTEAGTPPKDKPNQDVAPSSSRSPITATEKRVADQLAVMGLSSAQIQKQLIEIRKQANPVNVVSSRMDNLERSVASLTNNMQNLTNSIQKGFQGFVDMKLDTGLPSAPRATTKQGHAGHANNLPPSQGTPKELQQYLGKTDATRKQAIPESLRAQYPSATEHDFVSIVKDYAGMRNGSQN